MDKLPKISGNFIKQISQIANLNAAQTGEYLRQESDTLWIQSLLNLEYQEASELYKRMRQYVSEVVYKTPYSYERVWQQAWNYAEYLMVYGKWDEIFWRSYVDKFLTYE